ncbi:MAG: bile acid:sodium symporter family protein [Leptospirales bacterium]|nr:bile acid:sodium symporter family protein [Leptospirales bacterium]
MQIDQNSQAMLGVMLAVVMFGMGLGLTFRDFRRVGQTPWQVLIGSVGHFVLMPIAALAVVLILKLPPELAVGVIIVASCPSGATSNLLNFLAKTDVALAVIITALSTLLCPLFTPLIVKFLGGYVGAGQVEVDVSMIDMVKFVAVIIVIPVLLGMLLRKYAGKVAGAIEKPFKIFGILLLLGLIALVIFKNREQFLDIVGAVGVAVVLHNSLALLLGYFTPRLLRVPVAQSRTIAIEVAVQNTTLGLAIALQYFNATVAMPAAIFSLWMYITGLTLAFFWSKRPAPVAPGLHAEGH